MNVKEFIKNYRSQFHEYCPCVIAPNGEVYSCEKTSHLQELINISGDDKILNTIPEGSAPLFYLTAKLRCVLVDYENQIYCEDFTQEQRYALIDLAEEKLILMNPIDIKEKIEL